MAQSMVIPMRLTNMTTKSITTMESMTTGSTTTMESMIMKSIIMITTMNMSMAPAAAVTIIMAMSITMQTRYLPVGAGRRPIRINDRR